MFSDIPLTDRIIQKAAADYSSLQGKQKIIERTSSDIIAAAILITCMNEELSYSLLFRTERD